jgi:hypothetical protein
LGGCCWAFHHFGEDATSAFPIPLPSEKIMRDMAKMCHLFSRDKSAKLPATF